MKFHYVFFCLCIVKAQIALPTFHGAQKTHNTPPSNSTLEDIFGSSNTFTLMGNQRWTNSNAVTGWGDIDQNNHFFISYINITTSNATTYQTTQLETNGNGITATSATQTSGSYKAKKAKEWSSADKGVWWYNTGADNGVLTATMSGGWGTNRGIQIRNWESGHHKCYLVKVAANGITRYFAPKDMANPASPTGTSVPNHVFYPLNDTFTSFTDSRLTSLGTNDSVLPDSYFEYAP